MARKFPDRVAAIVDLMSHLFMLAVMLFVLSIPFRAPSGAIDEQVLRLTIGFLDGDGLSHLAAGLADRRTEASEIEFEVRLDDGMELQPLASALKFVSVVSRDNRIEIDGVIQRRFPDKAVILLTRFDDRLLDRMVRPEIHSQSARGTCNATSREGLVLGRDPVFRFDLVC